MRLTLLVPELIWPEPGDTQTLAGLAAPGFRRLDGRASFLRSTAVSLEKSLLEQFAVADAGIAALRRLGENGAQAEDGYWLCADPVHLRFHHERIVLADAGAFDLDDDEAATLIAALNAEFSDIGEFRAGSARRWYLRLTEPVAHVAAPLSAVAGRRMDGELDDKTSPLHRWLNEVQMFLHLHPVNAARTAVGKPAVNSLWLWGNGPDVQPADAHDALFGDDPLAVGLARAAGIPARPRPAAADEVLAGGGQNPLVVLDQLLPTVLYEDPDGWRTAFERLDADWLAPLCGRPGKKLKNLTVIAPTIYGQLRWTLSAGQRWKFWQTGRTPAQVALALAGPERGKPT